MARKQRQTILAISGLLLVIAFALHMKTMIAMSSVVLIITTLMTGFPIVKKAWQSALMKALSIELLVTIAFIGALVIGEYVESAALTFLFLFGDYLEARALEKTRSSLKSLIEMAPLEATILRNESLVTLPTDEILEGDVIVIQSGGKIAVDGRVVKGVAHINEATITGEPVPISKTVGDAVYSGTIVDHGYIKVLAEKVGDDTAFAKIIELVEEAQDSKAKSQRFLERFARLYTPAVIVLSIITFILTRDLQMTLTFLVIACPGALVISAPVSIVAGIGNGAKSGILIKGGETMEKLSKADTIVFDKTGTLTKGEPEVVDIRAFGLNEGELLLMAAEIEVISEHHLGRAIANEAKRRELILRNEPSNFNIVKGYGIKAAIEGTDLYIGNRGWILTSHESIPADIDAYAHTQEQQGKTAVFIASNSRILGVITISDAIREGSATDIQQLKKSGIKQIIMLTGDNQSTAERVAYELHIDKVFAECLPEDKVAKIRALKTHGHTVAMVGDGINDAPAIATADIGISMGTKAADVAMETADMVLMTDSLNKLTHAYQLSKATIRNMKQNMAFAIFVVALLIFGVLTRKVFLASGMFLHEFSVLIVILNAVRLIGFGVHHKRQILNAKVSDHTA